MKRRWFLQGMGAAAAAPVAQKAVTGCDTPPPPSIQWISASSSLEYPGLEDSTLGSADASWTIMDELALQKKIDYWKLPGLDRRCEEWKPSYSAVHTLAARRERFRQRYGQRGASLPRVLARSIGGLTISEYCARQRKLMAQFEELRQTIKWMANPKVRADYGMSK